MNKNLAKNAGDIIAKNTKRVVPGDEKKNPKLEYLKDTGNGSLACLLDVIKTLNEA